MIVCQLNFHQRDILKYSNNIKEDLVKAVIICEIFTNGSVFSEIQKFPIYKINNLEILTIEDIIIAVKDSKEIELKYHKKNKIYSGSIPRELAESTDITIMKKYKIPREKVILLNLK